MAGARKSEENLRMKMKKQFLFLILFLLSVSLAAAVNLQTDKTFYSRGDNVAITIDACDGTSVLQVYNAKTPVPEVVDISQGDGNWNAIYNTNSDSSDGKYLIHASCDDRTTAELNFCVNQDGCVTERATEQPEPQQEETPPAPGGGGGGGGCFPKWECSTWSICSPDLIHTRTCTDKNRCRQPKTETEECAPCIESWICSAWSNCFNGQQTRTCNDEHLCGTLAEKPALRKSCNAADPPPFPANTYGRPPSYGGPDEPSFFASLWDHYAAFVVGIPIALIVLVGIVFLVLHFVRKKKKVFNLDELKNWIKAEHAAGTSYEDIRKILADHTGWRESDIMEAFTELRGGQQSAQPTQKQQNSQPTSI